ncbi:hypothetical protein FHS61_002157 [Altererythrobacter atlanticus]|uniref:Uncharacterized protein n=1 Tax=Croceibacterium atlanticum TaxID=1267766 RepID=A0A0F7KR57_9SPHN|nr:hypothetical protein [Croceibacterium atlanticum]AKH41667.1 hypothetical protein WYH_00611 [Croceibacterium atlanticum]MBB5733131.1 hypothetical protein [Croceibacterium atlanticum]
MRAFGIILRTLGILLILAGLLWTLQGLGLIMWPAESFMLTDRSWAIRGGMTVVAGILLIRVSARLRRR